MTLLPADYAVLGVAAVFAATGLFRGLSGTVGFLSATVASAATATFGWPLSSRWLESPWARGLAVFVAALLVFGVVRMVVKKSVNGLLAQPSDAVFGMLVGVLAAALVLAAWAYSGFYIEYSSIASEVASYVR